MKNVICGLAAVVLALTLSNCVFAAGADIDGVTPGNWTMDLAAAEKLATAKKLPVLLDFSGSDWCKPCKVMEQNVFSAGKWKDYAKTNIIMVVIDFPNGEGIVPQKYVKRNEELKEKYGIEGYPTFVVLDEDAQTELGRLSAGEDKTPESFITELQRLFRYRAEEVAKYTKTLNPKDRETYLKIVGQLADTRKAVREQEQQIAVAHKKIQDLQNQGAEIEESAMRFRAAQLGADKLKEFNDLVAKWKQAQKKLTDWLKTAPESNQENAGKYESMYSELQQIAEKLREY